MFCLVHSTFPYIICTYFKVKELPYRRGFPSESLKKEEEKWEEGTMRGEDEEEEDEEEEEEEEKDQEDHKGKARREDTDLVRIVSKVVCTVLREL